MSADFSPKGYLIRYPFLVNACVLKFIEFFQDDFVRTKNGTFKIARKISAKTLKELLSKFLHDELSKFVFEKNSWLLISDSGYERRLCYEMVENDIDIDLNKMEKILDSIFNKFMKQKHNDARTIWCKHKLLISDDWEKICALKVFGKKRFEVADKELSERKKCIVEKFKDLDAETESMLSKKETSQLIVKECADYVLEKIASVKHV